jgi:hypothetical protein
MRGEDFLKVAEYLLNARPANEPHWRAAAGRAYYALFLEGRDWLRRAGFNVDESKSTHKRVNDLFISLDDEIIKNLGLALDRLHCLRKEANYDISGELIPRPGDPLGGQVLNREFNKFGHHHHAKRATENAREFIDRLRSLDANLKRRRLAISSIKGKTR